MPRPPSRWAATRRHKPRTLRGRRGRRPRSPKRWPGPRPRMHRVCRSRWRRGPVRQRCRTRRYVPFPEVQWLLPGAVDLRLGRLPALSQPTPRSARMPPLGPKQPTRALRRRPMRAWPCCRPRPSPSGRRPRPGQLVNMVVKAQDRRPRRMIWMCECRNRRRISRGTPRRVRLSASATAARTARAQGGRHRGAGVEGSRSHLGADRCTEQLPHGRQGQQSQPGSKGPTPGGAGRSGQVASGTAHRNSGAVQSGGQIRGLRASAIRTVCGRPRAGDDRILRGAELCLAPE